MSNGIPPSSVTEPPAVALFAVTFLGAAAFALFWRQDANWDLLNYHYYNAWAFLNGRVGFDIAPAQLQTFHNPALDAPVYLMAAADWPPQLIALILCLPTAIGAFFLVRIVFTLFRDLPRAAAGLAIAAALAIGLTGVNGIALNASTMNEWPGAAFALAALWLLLRDANADPIPPRTLAFSGLLMGMASGLKLTAATYAVGLAAAILVRDRPRRAVVDILCFGLPVLIGVALTAGYWMAVLESRFGNPLFPYFNQWFHSPLLPPEPVLSRVYGPHTFFEWLRFPFDLGFRSRGFVTEAPQRDFRFPVVYLLAILALIATIVRGGRDGRAEADIAVEQVVRARWRMVAAFFAVSFVVWTALHSVYRYLLPLELLTGAVIVRLVWRLVPRNAALLAIVGVGVALIVSTRYPNWGRVDFGPRFLEVRAPPIDAHALVVVAGDEPMAYVLPSLRADARHVGIENNLVRASNPSGLRDQAMATIATHDGPRYALLFPGAERVPQLEPYGVRLAADSCAPVRTNLTQDALALCRLEPAHSVQR